jgi:predicted N-acyltransferase
LNAQFLKAFSELPHDSWERINGSSNPFLSYEFLNALEQSDSASLSRGWQPHHLTLTQDDELTAVLPLYLKSHSWGEYVFDWDWAQAYERNGLEYYPKLVSTIPFTPVSSDKLISPSIELESVFQPLIDYCSEHNIASWHVLYSDEITALPENVYERNTVQFHWFNKGYESFDDYLATFASRKRKNTRKERESITKQGITVRRVTGKNITKQELDFFYLTYQLTYLKRQHTPHLTFEFFEQIVETMPDNMLLVIASHKDEDIACALFFHDETHLYGRYWGSSGSFHNLHFELCYYQGIEFCIEQKLTCFNPGTQGEHKIQRGFEPVLTHSYHWVKQPEFMPAIRDFCTREQEHMRNYMNHCRTSLPFKAAPTEPTR